MRVLCYKCGEWLETEKVGVTVRPRNYAFGFHGDILKCPKCGLRVIVTADQEDLTLRHPEIIYLRDDEQDIGEIDYIVEVRRTIKVRAESQEEAIEEALEILDEELMHGELGLEDIFEVYIINNG